MSNKIFKLILSFILVLGLAFSVTALTATITSPASGDHFYTGELVRFSAFPDTEAGPAVDTCSWDFAEGGTATTCFSADNTYTTNGTKAISYSVTDTDIVPTTIQDSISIIVYDTNTVPDMQGIPDRTFTQNGGVQSNTIDLHTFVIDTQSTDSALTFSIISESNPGVATCSVNDNQYISCNILNDFGFSDIQVGVTDARDYAVSGDTYQLSDTDYFRVNVDPANTAPVVTQIANQAFAADSGAHDNIIDLYDFTSDAEQADDELTYTILSQTRADIVNTIIDSSRYIDFTVQTGMVGTSTVVVQVSDGEFIDTTSFDVTVSSATASAPTATITSPAQDTTINAGDSVTFQGQALDSDGTIASYAWNFNGGAVNVTVQNPGSVQFNTVGTYTVTFTVTDNDGLTDLDNVIIYVGTITPTPPPPTPVEDSELIISDLDVEVDDESDKNLNDGEKISKDAKPGSVVKLNIEIKNNYDFDLEDVRVEAILHNIGEDNDDIEEESDEFDLDDGDKEDITLTFDIPLKVDDKKYTITINVRGEDRNNTRYSLKWTIYLDVEKDKHNVELSKAHLSPITIRCEEFASIDVEVTNIGRNDEDEVVIEARNSELELNFKRTEIELDEDIDDDDNDYRETINFRLPSDLEEGMYPIVLKAYYDIDRQSDTKTLNLVKEQCRRFVQDDVDVRITPFVVQPTDIIETPEQGFSFDMMIGLIIVGILVLGLAVYGIGYLAVKK